MDREILVAQLQKVARELRREYGPLALLLLVSADPAIDDDWHVVVSARGLNRLSWADGIRQVITLLRRALSRELWPQVKRVTVLRTDDPFVAAMASTFRTTKRVVDLQSFHVAGFEIPKGVLFTSRKVAA